MADLAAVHLLAYQLLPHIEDTCNSKILAGKPTVADQRPPDIACAHNRHAVCSIQAQNMGDLIAQPFDIISIALLPKFTKTVEILADLGGIEPKLLAHMRGGDALLPHKHFFA